MARGGAATAAIRRRLAGAGHEVLVDTGPVELIQVAGRFLLRQGTVAVDLTGVMIAENYQTARVVLGLRRGPDSGRVTLVDAEQAGPGASAAEPASAGGGED